MRCGVGASCSTGRRPTPAIVFRRRWEDQAPSSFHSEHLRHRQLTRRNDKARRCVYRRMLPPTYRWSDSIVLLPRRSTVIGCAMRSREMWSRPAGPHMDRLYRAHILSCRNLMILPRSGDAREAHSHVSLLPESRRHPVSRQREATAGFHDCCLRRRQVEALRRTESATQEPIEFPSSLARFVAAGQGTSGNASAVQSSVPGDRLILERYSPPAVLVNDKGHLSTSAADRQVPEPAAGKAN